MRVIEPIKITEAMLLASNVPETDHPAWLPGTAYAVDDKVVRNHGIYVAVTASTGKDPELDGTRTYWVRTGSTNRWRAFDGIASDPVEKSGNITYSIKPDRLADGVALFGLAAASVRVKCTDPIDGIIYDETRALIDTTPIFDAWTYCFEPISYDPQAIFSGVPIYTGVTLDLTISSTDTTGVGEIIIGRDQYLGETLVDSEIGFDDYSAKSTDDFGHMTLIERPYADTVDFQFSFPSAEARRVRAIIARLRATPAVYYAGPDTDHFGTTVYGNCRNFRVPLKTTISFGTLEIQGLI